MDQHMYKALKDESPIHYANRIGELYTQSSTNISKKEKGQFFTPNAIAEFMANQVDISILPKNVNILDPGCGSGVLSCALIERLSKKDKFSSIHVDAYETDLNIISITESVYRYLGVWLNDHGIKFSFTLFTSDFVLDNYAYLYAPALAPYDIIISNPPYFKLSKESKQSKAAALIADGQVNIYSIFMAISASLLKGNGQLIFIVPRSFASGRYFRKFRTFFFKTVCLKFVHLFNTRKDTFARDNVLQETIIIKCDQDKAYNDEVVISYSYGLNDLRNTIKQRYPLLDIIDMNSSEKILFLPINESENKTLNLFKSWTGSLNAYNIQISTGPVVAYRSQEYISEKNSCSNKYTPLYWLHNVVKMLVEHPMCKERKGQYILVSDNTKSILLPNKNYIFLRRFSSKDDNSRLIAAPYFGNMTQYPVVGVENKLNYIYRPKGHLSRFEIMGLAALLNSKLFDTYFRTFNGNINVSATELRNMQLPPIEIIQEIGKELILINNFSIENINFVINKYFNIYD